MPAITGDARDVDSIRGWEDPLEEGMANPLQYSCLENPWTEEPCGPRSTGSQELDTAEATQHTHT